MKHQGIDDNSIPETALDQERLLVERIKGGDEAALEELIEETLRRPIEKLPKLYKNVVQLHDIDGLPLQEISHVVRISIPAVKSRLFRARRIIHQNTMLLSQQGRKRRLSQ